MKYRVHCQPHFFEYVNNNEAIKNKFDSIVKNELKKYVSDMEIVSKSFIEEIAEKKRKNTISELAQKMQEIKEAENEQKGDLHE